MDNSDKEDAVTQELKDLLPPAADSPLSEVMTVHPMVRVKATVPGQEDTISYTTQRITIAVLQAYQFGPVLEALKPIGVAGLSKLMKVTDALGMAYVFGEQADALFEVVARALDQPSDMIRSIPLSEFAALAWRAFMMNRDFFVQSLLRLSSAGLATQLIEAKMHPGTGQIPSPFSSPTAIPT